MTISRPMTVAATAAAVLCLATAGQLAVAPPAYNVRANLNGQELTLSFDFPVAPACLTFLRWDLRDRVNLIQVGAEPPVPMWALTFTSSIHTYNHCTNPRRLVGQPFATVTRPRKGWARVSGARSRLRAPWTPWAQVCIHGIRTNRNGAAHGVTCVATIPRTQG